MEQNGIHTRLHEEVSTAEAAASSYVELQQIFGYLNLRAPTPTHTLYALYYRHF